ncbi:MAG: CHRD domain-containing protein [Candidatus Dormibacteraeota bacterium]|nr:CHRD domain-containing protein [Candidatus Dormibacteraeota bacterium]
MLKRIPLAIAAIALVLLPGATTVTASAPATHFVANLTGAQEVPPVDSAGTGRLDIRLVSNGTRLRFKLTSNGVSQITQSHIHIGAPGANGPVTVFFFAQPPAPWNSVTGDSFEVAGVRTASDVHQGANPSITFADLLAALRSGNSYVNIHSPSHPGGEIRGQIKPVSDESED